MILTAAEPPYRVNIFSMSYTFMHFSSYLLLSLNEKKNYSAKQHHLRKVVTATVVSTEHLFSNPNKIKL